MKKFYLFVYFGKKIKKLNPNFSVSVIQSIERREL